LPVHGAAEQIEQYRTTLDTFDEPHPAFELGLRWLADRTPAAPPAPSLVHGDYRNGNLIVDADGVRAVLDWELAHLGDPVEDLGWLCVKSWRFGIATRSSADSATCPRLAVRTPSGGPVDLCAAVLDRVGTLKWRDLHQPGVHPSHGRGPLGGATLGRRRRDGMGLILDLPTEARPEDGAAWATTDPRRSRRGQRGLLESDVMANTEAAAVPPRRGRRAG
jgi:hypothetical protein